MESITEFKNNILSALEENVLVKVTLSKPSKPSNRLKNIYIRPIIIRKRQNLSFTYRSKTNDQVKNYLPEAAMEEMGKLLESDFRIATLFTLKEDVALKLSKKGKSSIHRHAPTFSNKLPEVHDRPKEKRTDTAANDTPQYLHLLGVTNKAGDVIPKMADKFRQINKYLEIMETLLASSGFLEKDTLRIVDMGSGKGYLTFALYDFIQNKLGKKVEIIGIELRQELVEFCNNAAKEAEFDSLNFLAKPIEQFDPENSQTIDVLIALHACDTATDDALYKGLSSKAGLIVCAPCCHKQIRQQVKGKPQTNPILKYGIFKERQFEMITDTVRALILEQNGYDTKIFEFVSNEHTRKNIMLSAVKSNHASEDKQTDAQAKINEIKKEFDIDFHYLERKISADPLTTIS